MDVFETIQKRKSVRSYERKQIPREKLEKILEAARIAPSAKNVQPWHFIVVTNEEKKKELSKGIFAGFLKEASVVIVACGNVKASAEWYSVDVSLAVENMILTATSEGLGTCLVGSFGEKQVKVLLGIPENFSVIVLLAIGYAQEKTDLSRTLVRLVRRRKTLSDIVSVEEFGNKWVG